MAEERDNNQAQENDVSNEAEEGASNESQENENNSSNDSGNNSTSEQAADNEARFSRLESTLERVLGEISAIREAQGILVENGAVISEIDDDTDFTGVDSFVPPSEMDLLV